MWTTYCKIGINDHSGKGKGEKTADGEMEKGKKWNKETWKQNSVNKEERKGWREVREKRKMSSYIMHRNTVPIMNDHHAYLKGTDNV